MDIQAQVLGVTGRQSKNGQHTMYDVALSDGNKYTTFDGTLATQAQQLVGQQVSARVEIVQKGQYTNYNLGAIAPAGQLAPSATPAPAGTAVAAQVAGIPITPAASNGNGSKKFTEADATRITKLACISSAVELVGQLFQGAGPEAINQALDLVDSVAQKLYSDSRSHEAGDVPLPTTPAEVAAVVPGVQVGVTETPPTEGPTVPWS